ncbi:MAG: phosphate ABC transporter substrate-binding protein [Nitrospina sp.]|jgi:phosphate transport system substrate-binding protein|nr:phosphate ABC transporter substrate-binding protein [Nitrospina sp.]MBT3876144.1 phosphate ABC transporter substrate-binding protein [Nitrospina sp.]MBT4048901.1 phosphate ABC transporter substrate-binding protein [Nitrospina sp.]MBT4557756.1 phosphate ABC transporter substrate-binding protein [Nitrospina sp.]MBT5349961.1 phosphate ABC transporter substrate-binding protein [Nitrospina sp.]
MARYQRVWAGLILCLMVGFPLETVADTGLRVQIVGSTTVLPVASRSAQKFMQSSKVRIIANAGGSGVGIHSVAQSRADIGMASREISPDEKIRFEKSNLITHPVGLDAVACMVSAEIYQAGVRHLTRREIAGIYMGKIRNWKEVGGPDREIVVIDKERHRGTRHVFMNYIFGNALQRTPGTLLVTGSNNEEQTKIAQSDSAIGMLSFAWINEQVKAVTLRDQGKEYLPTWKAVQQREYPIVRKLNFITAGEPRGEVKAFIDFVKGPEGQKIIEESGYIPIGGN